MDWNIFSEDVSSDHLKSRIPMLCCHTKTFPCESYCSSVTVVVRQVIDGIRMAFFISSGRASFTSLRPVNDAEEPKRDVEEVPRTKNY